jgi:hypothetical protein
MRNAKLITVALAGTAVAGMAALSPSAGAATTATFTLTGGALTISEPTGTANNLGTLASTPLGTTTSGSLGTTTISDARGSLAGWTLSMAGTSFTTTTSGATAIPASNAVAYLTVPPTLVSGVAVVTNTHVAAVTGLALGAAAPFMTAVTTGSNSVSYNPSVQVTIPTTALAGTYTGTVTQTVA